MAEPLNIRQYTEAAMRRINAAVREMESMRREIVGRRRMTGFTYPNVQRPAIAYGEIPAGDANGAGKGEMKFLRINESDGSFGDPEDLPTTVYNLGAAIPSDNRLIAGLDIQGRHSDGSIALWITGYDQSATEFLLRPCELCISSGQTVTTDTKTYLRFDVVKNLNTEWYRPGDLTGAPVTDADTLNLLKTGWYEIGYSIMWEGPITSAGGTGGSDDIEWSEGDIYLEVAGTTLIPCSAAKHYVLHHNATGGSMGGTATRQVLFRTSPGNGQINLAVEDGSATHNRTFSGVMWANYLGHDLDPSTTITDIS